MKKTLMTITAERRITIPQEMLKELDWLVDDHVLIFQDDKKITIYKAKVEPITGD